MLGNCFGGAESVGAVGAAGGTIPLGVAGLFVGGIVGGNAGSDPGVGTGAGSGDSSGSEPGAVLLGCFALARSPNGSSNGGTFALPGVVGEPEAAVSAGKVGRTGGAEPAAGKEDGGRSVAGGLTAASGAAVAGS